MLQTKNSVAILLLVLALLMTACDTTQEIDRQEEVAEKGAEVMPFDLERTTHIFNKQTDGGLQQVISDDGDVTQIALIRDHLAEEAERFQSR